MIAKVLNAKASTVNRGVAANAAPGQKEPSENNGQKSPIAANEATQAIVLTKAALRAGNKLGVSQAALASILGVSEAQVSRMRKGGAALQPNTKPFELGVLFVRLFRSLDAIVGGDEAVARAWLANPNLALDAKPAEKIRTIAGLTDVIDYLDARKTLA